MDEDYLTMTVVFPYRYCFVLID